MDKPFSSMNLLVVFLIITWKATNGAKLERKQDFFDVDGYDTKREYRLNEIGKRGFTFDYAGSSEYGIGGATSSDFGSTVRTSSSDEGLSPARDLMPPPPMSGVYASSTSPPSKRSDYSKLTRISSQPSSKDFHSSPHLYRRSQISRRSPHLQTTSSLNSYFDELSHGAASGSRGRSPASFSLVADNDGKLIGYRGSILPGYSESPSVGGSSSSPGISSDPQSSSFVGGYFSGPPSSSTLSSADYAKSKFSLASSASSGSYSSTPIYYPGRKEDHSYRMRDTTSQGYEDEESNPSLEDNDFNIGGSTYQPSPLPPPPAAHRYQLRGNDGFIGHSRHLESSRFSPYTTTRSDSPGSSYYYGPLSKTHDTKRSYGPSSSSNYGITERVIPYSYSPLTYNDYGST